MKRAWILLVALPAMLFALGQEPMAEKATVQIKLDAKEGKPGATIKGKVLVTFADGWHGYQNPPMRDYEIPLKIESATKEIKLKATYPKGETKDFAGAKTIMYEGTVAVPVTITLPKKAGPVTLKVVASYQQCNESTCLPPQKSTAEEKLVVKNGKG